MAILHGEFCLEFIIIFGLGLIYGSSLIKVFSHEDVVLKKIVTLNDFSGILGDGQIGSMCGIHKFILWFSGQRKYFYVKKHR